MNQIKSNQIVEAKPLLVDIIIFQLGARIQYGQIIEADHESLSRCSSYLHSNKNCNQYRKKVPMHQHLI